MMDWLTQTITLPRWVVWGSLLTSPALWSERFRAIVKRQFGGDDGASASE